jgi:hypothetical protein
MQDLVLAETPSNEHAAVAAHNNGKGFGVWAFSQGGTAILATNDRPGTADADAFVAFTSSPNHAAVAGHNNGNGFGVWAFSQGGTAIKAVQGSAGSAGSPVGHFEGDVYTNGNHHVTGDLVLINSSADIAEDFDLEDDPSNAEPGTVLVIHPSGRLSACAEPYDTRVAGVVSGAGDLRPAIVLQRLQDRSGRSPVALLGKAVCKVDAAFGGIAAGDLLTTSPTLGHAMKVADRAQAVGAILGKALHSLDTGRGLVPILVSLR